jgi:hypothetical protein
MQEHQRVYYFKLLSDPFIDDRFIQNNLLLLDSGGAYLEHHPNIYKNTELEIDVESINEYKECTYDLIRYSRLDIPESILEENECTSHIIAMKQRRVEIKIEWMKKYIKFMTWKRRRQLLAVWDKL